MDLQSIKNRFGVIGNTPSLNYALQVAQQVANTDLTVLINGESGVGKEVFSQVIHSLSARKHNQFIAVNCGAIPEGTIDSELFGHEKGSFTGASDARKGYFETVNGGTIFLDEIGEMPIGTQARLLRVLETGEYIRVGSSKVQKTDVRVVAATNRELLDEVQKGKFREDLYYRLNTVPIKVPALRERKDDIPLLFRKFAVDFAEKYRTAPVQLDDEAKVIVMQYMWRGNVRELKNVAEQISVLSSTKNITAKEILQFLPAADSNSYLPMVTNKTTASNDFANEREILYKLFFDMKRDVTELKKMFVEMIKNPNAVQQGNFNNVLFDDNLDDNYAPIINNNNLQPVMVNSINEPTNLQHNNNNNNNIQEHTIIEESLNIMDKEKELIIKALKKHRSKRKDAAIDLGISERTLYRKLKDYDIEDL
jgi:DNA-binding NtrC family response regulator